MARSGLHRRLGSWFWAVVSAIVAAIAWLIQEIVGNWVMADLSAYVSRWPSWMWWTYEHRYWVYPMFIVALTAIIRLSVNGRERRNEVSEGIAEFIEEGQRLRAKLQDVQPQDLQPTIRDHNEWVERAGEYLEDNLNKGFRVRFRDFTGLKFYSGSGDPEISKMRHSIDGSLQRLAEFLSELARN